MMQDMFLLEEGSDFAEVEGLWREFLGIYCDMFLDPGAVHKFGSFLAIYPSAHM